MKIVHICLANFYVDGMGYQENLITKFHAKSHNVFILTSDYAFDASGRKTKKNEKNYINEFGIPVKVLEKSRRYGYYSRYKDFKDVYSSLKEIDPDVIFCHGGQFIALKDVIKYCKKNKLVKLYIDQHGDYYNTPVNTVKSKIVYKYIYGHWLRKAVPYTTKFWGVTPWRCQYLHEVYGLPKDKIDLLIMGGDDDKIHLENLGNIRKEMRNQHNIAEDDFLIITGGKIDKNKNIHLLVEAIKEIGRKNIKLLIFGQPVVEFEEEFLSITENIDVIKYIGWISSDAVYDYFLASDLCAFPGTHSVLWEQACACGLPGLFKSWEGMHHVNVDGNAIFLNEDCKNEIKNKLLSIVNNRELYEKMRLAAKEARKNFSYKEIAKKAIDEE